VAGPWGLDHGGLCLMKTTLPPVIRPVPFQGKIVQLGGRQVGRREKRKSVSWAGLPSLSPFQKGFRPPY
jgi:hypothetical protein